MTPLWSHQQEALDFVDGKPAAMLAMAMGVGKTRVAIELLVQRKAGRTLILCPRSVVNVWPAQATRYSSLTTLALNAGPVAKRQEAAAKFRGNLVVINYDACWRTPFKEWALAQPWDALICDESHRLKAPGGIASRFVTRLASRIPFRLALTGTPMPHSPLDIYAQYRVLEPEIFGTSYRRFMHEYALTKPMQGFEMIIGYKNLPQLHKKVYQIAFRVEADVLNLPDPVHEVRSCTLAPAASKLYKSLESDFYAEVDAGVITAANAMVKALRLQQLTSGFGKLADDGEEVQIDVSKHDLLVDILEDLDEPVVVFCRFRHDLDAVHYAAQCVHRGSLELSGRRDDLAAWQAGEAPVLAVQTQAGGVGIDLTRARVAIYYSLGLSLGDHLQSQARLQRPGQTRTVAYYYLLADNTIDHRVFRALAARKDVIDALLRRDKNGATDGTTRNQANSAGPDQAINQATARGATGDGRGVHQGGEQV